MHGSTFKETLRDFFSEDILPQEYGGSGPSMEEVCQEWTSHILQSEERLTQLSTCPAGDEVTPDPETEPDPDSLQLLTPNGLHIPECISMTNQQRHNS